MAWTASNPVSIGNATKKSDYDKLWDNVALLAGNPWMVDINPFLTATSNVNWSTITAITGQLGGFVSRSGGSQNDEIVFPIFLSAGTWTFSMLHQKNTDVGIYSVQFDTVEKGTIDGYDGGQQLNQIGTVTGITVSAPAKIALKLKMATKNGSSSSYYSAVTAIRLLRTA